MSTISDTDRLNDVRKVLEGLDGGEELAIHDTIAEAVQCVVDELKALRQGPKERVYHGQED